LVNINGIYTKLIQKLKANHNAWALQ
jgi:hypothetical protein